MSHPESHPTPGTPIWLAALAARGCRAISDRGCHPIGWQWLGGRAIYTNASPEPEAIDPLGVTLNRGETLSVTWIPGETEYTLDVARSDQRRKSIPRTMPSPVPVRGAA